MAHKKKDEGPPKNVPIINVRQQYTTKCGETCAGQGHNREKKYPPCGPSPPSTATEDQTCGLKSCIETGTCRCRCHCALRELMRQKKKEEAMEPATPSVTTHETLDQEIPDLSHMARIHTLEPKLPCLHYRRWPREQIWREQRRHFSCRSPRYAHAVLENMMGPPRCSSGNRMLFYIQPNGVRDFWKD